MMSDIPKTLHDLARENVRPIGRAPSQLEITEALKAADIDPLDELERERFCRLVAETSKFQESEEFARLRPYVEQAEEELLDSGATENDILTRAGNLWSECEESERQMREECESE